MSLCTCPATGPRPVLLEIGDYARVISVTCPTCGEYVLDPGDAEQMAELHATDLLVTMTVIREATAGEDDEYVWYSLTPPPAELLEDGR